MLIVAIFEKYRGKNLKSFSTKLYISISKNHKLHNNTKLNLIIL